VLAILNSLGAGEAIAILVIALIVLGPEKLPDAIRKFGNIYGELRRMSHGFQSELRDAFDEPLRELRGTAQMMQDAVNEPAKAVKAAATAPVVGGAKKAAEPADEATDAADKDKDKTTPAAQASAEESQSPVDETQAPVDETQSPVDETQAPVDETQAPVDEAGLDGDTAAEQPPDDGQPVLAQAGLMVSEPELAVPVSNGQGDEPWIPDEPVAAEPPLDAGQAPAGEEGAAADAPRDR
jgi:sec-independent protein translocase protein TatB